MNDKVYQWRNCRMNRRCIYCKYLSSLPNDGPMWCYAKKKVIDNIFPDFTRVRRLFCKLYEVKEE